MVGQLARGLLNGIVIQTETKSITGKYLYSDFAEPVMEANQDPFLNKASRYLLVGIAAGVTRIALGVIHVVGHLLASVIFRDKGHFFHAAKGLTEILRGAIETIPLIGRIFANSYSAPHIYNPWNHEYRSWWMIKIYNPQAPDTLDRVMRNWDHFPENLRYNFD